jgi:hypothetical protein
MIEPTIKQLAESGPEIAVRMIDVASLELSGGAAIQRARSSMGLGL